MKKFVAIIHKDADSDYGVSLPELPSCVSAGVDRNEALAFHLEGMEADGKPIPSPSSLENIRAKPEFQDGVAILVAARKALAS